MAKVDDLLPDALEMPRSDRARLAKALLHSLDDAVDEDADEAWVAELRRRVEEVQSGAVELEDWEDVRVRIKRRLADRKR